jgi:hypothetical protein
MLGTCRKHTALDKLVAVLSLRLCAFAEKNLIGASHTNGMNNGFPAKAQSRKGSTALEGRGEDFFIEANGAPDCRREFRNEQLLAF